MKFLKGEQLKFLKNRKLLIIVGIVLIAAAAGFLVIRGRAVKANASVSEQRTAVVSKGTLNVTLSGSGTVSPTQRKDITVQVNGEIEESYLEEGKAFKAGDVLLKLKDTDAQLALKKLENTVKQKESAVSGQNLQNGALNITAPISGRVSDLKCNVGDSVNKGMTLMTLVDESTLQTSVTFENASTSQFSGKRTVQLQIPDFMASLTGQIKSIVQDGSNVHAIITVENPGALKSGMSAWAEVQTKDGTLTSTQGTLDVQNKVAVIAEQSGTVSNLLAYADEKVSAGKLLLSISGDDLAYTIEGEQLDLEQANLELEQARENLEDYTIKAPFDGIVTTVTALSKGDSIKAGTNVGIIMNTGEMSFQVAIDELDISQVQAGQKVLVSAEALEDTASAPIEGKVTAVASEGTSSNGVTSYPVTVTIPGREGLRSSMNVDAVIHVLTRENTLLVPIEAVQKQGNGYIVWVKGGQQQTQQGTNNNSANGTKGGAQRGQMAGRVSPGGIDFANMTDEEKEAMRQKYAESGQGWSGGAQGGQRSTGTTGTNARANRQNSASSYYSGAVPVKVTVGQHNETYMEITEGLKEGDIIVLPQLVSNSSSNSNANAKAQSGGFMPNLGGGGMVRQVIPDVKRGN